jgi:hypothetical protein
MSVNQVRRKGRFAIGLAVILFLYCIYNVEFLYNLFAGMPLRTRHFIKLLFVLLVYGAGFVALRRDVFGWMMRCWHLLYFVTLLLLLLLGFFDWFAFRLPVSVRSIADDLQELLVSPLPYICILLLRRGSMQGGSLEKGTVVEVDDEDKA